VTDVPPTPPSTQLEDEVRASLRELVDELGALSARIVEHDDLRTGIPARTLPLGGGEFLRVELPARTNHEHDLEQVLERATRQLRAIRRRWEIDRLPEIMVAPGVVPTGVRVIERIESYLQALSSIDRATNCVLARAGQLVASARPPDELEAARWPFLARRALATHAPNSSYGEVVDPDAYAVSFYYGAVIVLLLAEPYAIDFVRHRARQVTRELAVLLPMLDPEPGAPAVVRRRPPTQH
jgi:hypothetical protein